MLNLNNKIKILLGELGDFLADIENQPALAIHGIRKRSKFIRSLLRLMPDMPSNLTGNMKLMSRLISPYRDAQVMLDTYLQLKESPKVEAEPDLEATLRDSPYLQNPIPHAAVIDILHKQLFDFNLQFRISTSEPSTELIYRQLDQSYETGKVLFRQVQTSSDSELLHSWRKKTKNLWYQLRFVFGDELADPDHPLSQSNTLGTQLGMIHDLDVFIELLTRENFSKLFTKAQEPRLHLLKQSLILGERLFSRRILSHSILSN